MTQNKPLNELLSSDTERDDDIVVEDHVNGERRMFTRCFMRAIETSIDNENKQNGATHYDDSIIPNIIEKNEMTVLKQFTTLNGTTIYPNAKAGGAQ